MIDQSINQNNNMNTDFTYSPITRMGVGRLESPNDVRTPPIDGMQTHETRQLVELPGGLTYAYHSREMSSRGIDTVCGTDKSLTSLQKIGEATNSIYQPQPMHIDL